MPSKWREILSESVIKDIIWVLFALFYLYNSLLVFIN